MRRQAPPVLLPALCLLPVLLALLRPAVLPVLLARLHRATRKSTNWLEMEATRASVARQTVVLQAGTRNRRVAV